MPGEVPLIAENAPLPRVRVSGRNLSFFVVACSFLAALTNIKFGPVQLAEFFLISSVGFWFFYLLLAGGVIPVHREVLGYASRYAVLMACIGALTLWHAATETFYIPSQYGSVLQLPPWVGLSRLFEFSIVIFCFLLLTQVLIGNPELRIRCIRAYVAAGTVSSVYAILCVVGYYGGLSHVGALAGFFLPTSPIGGAYHASYNTIMRARGFFVEGGPFGVYLTGSLLLAWAYPHLGIDRPRERMLALAIQGIAFALAWSKAGMVAGFALFILFLLARGLRWRTWLSILVAIATMAAVAPSTPFYRDAEEYFYLSRNFERYLAVLGTENTSFVMGRVAAMVIVPRMVAENPILGVGFGNYGVTRNDPKYRGVVPPVAEIDSPGIGVLGYVSELGIPLTAALFLLLCRPALSGFGRRRSRAAFLIAAYQPIAHLVGAQVTFFYPWVVSAIAVAVAVVPQSSFMPAEDRVHGR